MPEVVAAQVLVATKNAVRTLSEGLRQEAGDSLRVTVVSPGAVRTDFAERMDPAAKSQVDKLMDIALTPDSVARAIAFAVEQPHGVDVGDIVRLLDRPGMDPPCPRPTAFTLRVPPTGETRRAVVEWMHACRPNVFRGQPCPGRSSVCLAA